MDTISINLIFRKNFERMEVIYEMEDYIKNIKSSNGYKYCDVLSNSRRDRKSTRLNSSHMSESRMPSSA